MIATALVFALYLLTLAPSVAMWDTGEYMAAVKVLGIPHPPGNPFFMLLGHAFASIPIPVSYAARVNILAALASAGSAGIWFIVIERITARWIELRWQRLVVAAVGTLIGATAFTVWNQAVVNEKVYPVSLLFVTIISWLTIKWIDDPDAPRADRLLVLVGFLLGLGYANHPAGMLAAPAIAVGILIRKRGLYGGLVIVAIALLAILLRIAGASDFIQTLIIGIAAMGAAIYALGSKTTALTIAGLLLGLTPFIYEPIRAAHFPGINEGAPTACETKLEASCTFDSLTWKRLMSNINREQYGPKLERGASYPEQVGTWWLYFKWQWLRDSHNAHAGWQEFLALLFLILALTGGYVHWKEDRETFWYIGALMFTMTLALIYYLNFKYGWSQDPGSEHAHEVRDRDYFYVWSFSAWGIWASLGLELIWSKFAATIASGVKGKKDTRETAVAADRYSRALLMASPVLLLALVPLFGNWKYASRAGQHFTQEWAHDYLNSLEPYAIVVTNGDNDTFPLWYAQEVEGVRKDVTVAVATYLGTDWYVRQIIRRPIADYDSINGPAIYRGKTWKKPSGPPLKMGFAEADSIPEYIELREAKIFKQGNITLNIPPGYLTRDELVLLRLIKDAMPERPLYLSTGAESGIGLEPYLLTQGYVQKIMPDPVPESPATPRLSGLNIDLARTKALWFGVYRAPDAIIKEGDWIDRPSYGIPYTYAFTGAILSEALARSGDARDASVVLEKVKKIVKAARIEGFPIE
ncbi:MAG: DUF2723 domain-containing protein [Gemmatimonadaceae bacterium]|nr:DUF2723 domain-containing protein [Gemmatimonadaceae bacterium]